MHTQLYLILSISHRYSVCYGLREHKQAGERVSYVLVITNLAFGFKETAT